MPFRLGGNDAAQIFCHDEPICNTYAGERDWRTNETYRYEQAGMLCDLLNALSRQCHATTLEGIHRAWFGPQKINEPRP